MTLRPDPAFRAGIASVSHELQEAGIRHTCVVIECWPKNDKEREAVRRIGRHCVVEADA